MDPVSSKSPVIEFESQEQINQYLDYWKDVLFLNDWIIKCSVTKVPLTSQDGTPLGGCIEFQVCNKCGTIKIYSPSDKDKEDIIVKHCEEETMVHELLHCKYNWIKTDDSIESIYFDTMEHSLLEQMAKSLIMAKYNLKFSWFKNF